MINATPFSKTGQQRWTENLFLLLCGGVLYYGAEVAFRGWSHWSMAVCGGLALLFLYRFNERWPRLSLPLRAFIGALAVTALEFCAGCVFNLWLGMKIWDYSNLPLQLLGQICLPFSVIWFAACFPVCGFCRLLRRKLFLQAR